MRWLILDFMNVIKKRRTVRKYKSDPVPEDILNQVLEAARLAPSGSNLQPWHFIVIKDKLTKEKLMDLPLGKMKIHKWAVEAPILIVACTDPSVSWKWHIVDLTIALEHLMLAATNFGLGTCWLARLGFEEPIKEILDIPKHIKVLAITPLGYPDEEPKFNDRKPISEIVHYEKFDKNKYKAIYKIGL